jgi:hypothetical protein
MSFMSNKFPSPDGSSFYNVISQSPKYGSIPKVMKYSIDLITYYETFSAFNTQFTPLHVDSLHSSTWLDTKSNQYNKYF